MLSAILAAGSIALSAVAAPVLVVPTEDRPTDKMVIDVVTVNGTGCPIGTAAVAVSPDNTAFTVTYSEYTAEVGPGLAASAARKNCQLNLNVHVPSGFTYAVNQTDYRGFADLAPGATGVERASYYFQGMASGAYIQHTIPSGTGNWQFSDAVQIASFVWHPCGAQRNLNVNTEVRVVKGTSAANSSSYVAMDSTDGSINTIFHFSWARC